MGGLEKAGEEGGGNISGGGAVLAATCFPGVLGDVLLGDFDDWRLLDNDGADGLEEWLL